MADAETDDHDEPPYFAYSATLRIHGQALALDEITRELGLTPTHVHRKGEPSLIAARPCKDDAWHFEPSVNEERELTHHLRELWKSVKPHAEYLRSIEARVDVFCGYRSNCDTAGFIVEPDALEIFTALNVQFQVSVIVA